MDRVKVRNEGELEKLLRELQPMPHRLLGEILREEGAITEAQLEAALTRQRAEPGIHLGALLCEMGVTTSEQINLALAHKFGIPYVKLDEFEIDQQALALVPADIALHYNVLPLGLVRNRLVLATENPLNFEAIDVVRFHTNYSVDLVLCSAQDISQALNRYYSHFDEDQVLEDLDGKAELRTSDEVSDAHAAEREAMRKPVVRLLNAMILQAVSRKASDINIRPEKQRVNIYFRVDGKLQFVRSLHKALLPALVSRIKIVSGMDIAERRLPQDGHMRLVQQKNHIDLRVSVVPTINGESVVIRILDKQVGVKPLDQLGFRGDDLPRMQRLLSRSFGMFLVTGPTGSGKSTTLYAILNEVKKGNPHIITVEDPVEYDVDGVEQIQTSNVTGYTFAEALRHILRHDPDVIMLGEIRDLETAQIANKAALTGHLVLSTLHTNDAASAVTRLMDMGIEPFLLGSTLLGVLAQRLVRLNCTHCREAEVAEPLVRRTLQVGESEVFYRGKGCPACNYTGYSGRTMVYELMSATSEVAEAIRDSHGADRIRQEALAQGMCPLTQEALALAREGKTSLEEVYAVRLE